MSNLFKHILAMALFSALVFVTYVTGIDFFGYGLNEATFFATRITLVLLFLFIGVSVHASRQKLSEEGFVTFFCIVMFRTFTTAFVITVGCSILLFLVLAVTSSPGDGGGLVLIAPIGIGILLAPLWIVSGLIKVGISYAARKDKSSNNN